MVLLEIEACGRYIGLYTGTGMTRTTGRTGAMEATVAEEAKRTFLTLTMAGQPVCGRGRLA